MRVMRFGARLMTLGVLLMVPLVYSCASESLRVDACLDAGGSFDYARDRCDHESGHPHEPFAERHVGLAAAGGLGAALVVAGLVTYRRGGAE